MEHILHSSKIATNEVYPKNRSFVETPFLPKKVRYFKYLVYCVSRLVRYNFFVSWVADQVPVVQTLDSAIHWINDYPLDNSIGFARVYPLDSDLSGGQRYPSFEQLEPGVDSTISGSQ